MLSSRLCTCIPIAAGKCRQSHSTETDSVSSFSPFPNYFLVWDSNLCLATGIFPAQLHRAMREKPVPGSQPLNPLGYPYQTSHQRFWGSWGTLGKTTSRVGGAAGTELATAPLPLSPTLCASSSSAALAGTAAGVPTPTCVPRAALLSASALAALPESRVGQQCRDLAFLVDTERNAVFISLTPTYCLTLEEALNSVSSSNH